MRTTGGGRCTTRPRRTPGRAAPPTASTTASTPRRTPWADRRPTGRSRWTTRSRWCHCPTRACRRRTSRRNPGHRLPRRSRPRLPRRSPRPRAPSRSGAPPGRPPPDLLSRGPSRYGHPPPTRPPCRSRPGPRPYAPTSATSGTVPPPTKPSPPHCPPQAPTTSTASSPTRSSTAPGTGRTPCGPRPYAATRRASGASRAATPCSPRASVPGTAPLSSSRWPAAPGARNGRRLAAADACRWIGGSVARSHARLSDDIRAGRRGDLKSGLQRLTDRTYGKLRGPGRRARHRTVRVQRRPALSAAVRRPGVPYPGVLRHRRGRPLPPARRGLAGPRPRAPRDAAGRRQARRVPAGTG